MEIIFEEGDDQSTKEVVAKHLGGRLGQPTTFGNGTSIPDRDLCHGDRLPDVYSYISAINLGGVIFFTLGALAVLTMLYLYLDTLRHVMKNSFPSVKTHTAFVVSVYPVVGIASYCGAVVPRSQLLAEAVAQGMFMFAMYQLFCLIVSYCGGEAELIRRVKPNSLDTRVAPCCCWPCCCFLPSLTVNKRNVRLLRMLVLQLPVVQGLVYMILLVMWAEEDSLYQVNYMYVQPFVVLSILLGVWGMVMTIRMLRDTLSSHFLPAKFLVLQLVLFFCKFQGLSSRLLMWVGVLPCNPPLTPAVYANLIYSSLMLLEMVMLGFWARFLYKKELPNVFPDRPDVEQVCSVPTVYSTALEKMEKTKIPENGQQSPANKTNNNDNGYDNNNFIDVKL